MAKDEKAKSGKSGKKGISFARHIVQVVMLVIFLLPLLISGWALFGLTASGGAEIGTPASLPFYGTLSSSSIGPISLMDPLAVLSVIAASKSFDIMWIVYLLPVIIVYGVIRGRAFCGWVCPANLLLEIVDWIREKLHIKVKEMALPRHVKCWVALAVIVLSLLFSFPVFEMFSPIGAISKFLVVGGTAGSLTLLAIIIAELFWGHRVWCRSICPLGGCYELLGKVGQVNVQIKHDACIGCNACKKVCLCDPQILQPAIEGKEAFVSAGDCMLCGKCVDACPTQALVIGFGRKGIAGPAAVAVNAPAEAAENAPADAETKMEAGQ